jgi:uncharacterized membrane protein
MSDPQPRARRRPRPRPLTVAIAVISLAGVAIATYLTILHYAGSDPVCVGGGGGCHVVQSSDYAELAGIPVSLIGLVGYVALGLSLLVPGEPGRALGMGLALAGAGFSLYLTYLELWVIDAICQWCVASAILMVLLAILMTIRLLRHGAPPPAPRTRT